MDTGDIRIVFMGTPTFAVPSLRALMGLGEIGGRTARVVAVVTQPDRPAGRGGRMQASPVKECALEAGVPVLQPERLRRPESTEELRSYAPDLIVVAAFAQILSPAVLDLPRYGCLNVHASLLPRWRGATPIPAAILAGDRETGVTIMRMDAGLDTGQIVAMRHEAIQDTDTTGGLTERLAGVGARLLAETVGPWVAGEIDARAQPEDGVTLTRPLSREDGRIDWERMSAVEIERMTRAYDPWPGAWTTLGGRLLKVWSVDAWPAESFPIEEPGRVLTREEAAPLLAMHDLSWPRVLIAARGGIVHARRVQPEGKRIMGGDEFLRGGQGAAGMRLG